MLAKNRIIQAVYDLFGELADKYKQMAAALPAELTHLHPKISKGENYLGLPWVMLDYPRHFAGKDGFAVRTMFWWGNYFSLHLLLQGKYTALLTENFQKEVENKADWYFCVGETPWQHHFESDYVVPFSQLLAPQIEAQKAKGFCKLSIQVPLSQWTQAIVLLEKKFAEALQLV